MCPGMRRAERRRGIAVWSGLSTDLFERDSSVSRLHDSRALAFPSSSFMSSPVSRTCAAISCCLNSCEARDRQAHEVGSLEEDDSRSECVLVLFGPVAVSVLRWRSHMHMGLFSDGFIHATADLIRHHFCEIRTRTRTYACVARSSEAFPGLRQTHSARQQHHRQGACRHRLQYYGQSGSQAIQLLQWVSRDLPFSQAWLAACARALVP